MFSLLAFLFDFIRLSETPPTREQIHHALVQADFDYPQIRHAILCLDALFFVEEQPIIREPQDKHAIRIFNHQEQMILPNTVQGLLHVLHQEGSLNGEERELLIRALMCLPTEEITLENTKILILIMQLNHSDIIFPSINELLSVLPKPQSMH